MGSRRREDGGKSTRRRVKGVGGRGAEGRGRAWCDYFGLMASGRVAVGGMMGWTGWETLGSVWMMRWACGWERVGWKWVSSDE
jgi:hypothetical protein